MHTNASASKTQGRPIVRFSIAAGILLALVGVTVLVRLLGLLPPDRSGKAFYPVSNAAALESVPEGEEHVFIGDKNLTDAQLDAFLKGRQLKTLKISNCNGVTAAGLKSLTVDSGLVALLATDTGVADDISSVLERLDTLEVLELGSTRVHELSEDAMSRLRRLRVLEVSNCAIAPILLERCARLPALEKLSISNCRGLSAQEIAVLQHSRSLKHLDMNSCAGTRDTVNSLCRIPTLRYIDIRDVRGLEATDVDWLRSQYKEIKFEGN